MPNPSIQMEVRDDHTKVSKTTDESMIPTSPVRVNSSIRPSIKSRKPVNIEIFDEPLRPIEPVIDTMVQVARWALRMSLHPEKI